MGLFAQIKKGEKRMLQNTFAGLSEAEAKARLAKVGENRLRGKKGASVAAMFFSQFKDLMILILAAATLISVLMTCSSAWMESALSDPNGGQRFVVYDEAWRLMQYPSLLRRMDAQWRLARHYGISNMLVFHKLSDLDNVGDAGTAMRALASSLLANAEVRIVYRQEPDQLGTTAAARFM